MKWQNKNEAGKHKASPLGRFGGAIYWQNWLDTNRWAYFKFCTCGGTPKYKYRHGVYELHVLHIKRTWRLFKQGKPFATGPVCETMNTEIDNLTI